MPNPHISFDELRRRLLDPDVPEAKLAACFEPDDERDDELGMSEP